MPHPLVRGGPVLARILHGLTLIAVVFSLLVSSTLPVFAQAGGTLGNLNGQILSDTGTPVAGATVSIASPTGSYHQQTDTQGRFHFLNVQTDTYTIAVTATGFETLTQAGITVTGGGNIDLGAVRMTKHLTTIGRVASRSTSSAFQPNQTIPQYTISGAVLENAQGKAASASENDALLAIPGFQIDSVGNIILEGSTTDQVHYQFDGVDFTDPGFSRSINNNFFNGISSIQAVPGAGDPSQGDSGAGVVNLVVKRGTYPSTGLLDLELLPQPYSNQINFQYGIASRNGKFSDYVSEFGTGYNYQVGPFPQGDSFNQGTQTGTYGPKSEKTNDFVNNFVYKFGKDNNQSLQFLFYSQADTLYGDPAGTPLQYENNAPDLVPLEEQITGLTLKQLQQIQPLAPGQSFIGQTLNPVADTNTSTTLTKFEYDNQLNTTTSLVLRFFHSVNYAFSNPTISQTSFQNVAGTEQTAGGARTGANFALTKQVGSSNLLTLSGQYEFNQPNFGAIGEYIGITTLGVNAQDFLTPANYGAPINQTTNPCPSNVSTANPGCYLYTTLLGEGKLPANVANFPKLPPLDLQSYEVQKQYGVGLRDQITLSSKLNLDLGVRYDLINNGYGNANAVAPLQTQDVNTQPVPGAPTVFNIANFPFVEQPHFVEPRAAVSYRFDRNDNISFTYGRSINLEGSGELASPESAGAFSQFANIPVNPNFIPASNPFTGQPASVGPANCYPNIPFPVGATSSTAPSYKGSVGTTLQLGRPCANYGDLLYQAEDAFFPEITAVQPSVFDNYDVTYAHLFKNGSALKINPFNRQGYKVQAITAPEILVNGVEETGSLVSTDKGSSVTTGANVEYTLPERREGFTGFVSLTYINEFTNTPAAGDNDEGAEDFEPIILPASLAAGDIFRAGFVSPLSLAAGPAYKTRSGFRFSPVIHFNIGYPYNDGLLTPTQLVNGTFENVPNTNFSDQFGAAGAPQFVDPANPGQITKPNVAANRGTQESAADGGLLSKPQATADFTISYTKPGSRSTFGVQVLDLFNNGIYAKPTPNTLYQPVVNGVGGPLTGQNAAALIAPGLIPVIPTGILPYSPYTVGPTLIPGGGGANQLLPLTFRLFYQLAL
jgi:hypothetical protein